MLQHAATHCNSYGEGRVAGEPSSICAEAARRRFTLQHAAVRNTLQYATRCNTNATHCNSYKEASVAEESSSICAEAARRRFIERSAAKLKPVLSQRCCNVRLELVRSLRSTGIACVCVCVRVYV